MDLEALGWDSTVEVLQNTSNPCCIYSFIPADGQKLIFIDFDMTLVVFQCSVAE